MIVQTIMPVSPYVRLAKDAPPEHEYLKIARIKEQTQKLYLNAQGNRLGYFVNVIV